MLLSLLCTSLCKNRMRNIHIVPRCFPIWYLLNIRRKTVILQRRAPAGTTLISDQKWTAAVMGQAEVTCNLAKGHEASTSRLLRHSCRRCRPQSSHRETPTIWQTQDGDTLQNNGTAIFKVLWNSKLRTDCKTSRWKETCQMRCTTVTWVRGWGSRCDLTLLSLPLWLHCGSTEQGWF